MLSRGLVMQQSRSLSAAALRALVVSRRGTMGRCNYAVNGASSVVASSGGGVAVEPPALEMLSRVVKEPVVAVVSQSCGYCTATLDLLKTMGVPVSVIQRDAYGADALRALYAVTGCRTVPQIFVGGSFVGGNSELQQLHRNGMLKGMLRKVGGLMVGPGDAIGDVLGEGPINAWCCKQGAAVDAVSLLDSGLIVLFGVPGPFTPVCNDLHLPGFMERVDELHALGVNDIICASSSDRWSVQAWAKSTGADAAGVHFLATAKKMCTRLGVINPKFGSIRRFLVIFERGVVRYAAAESSGVELTSAESAASAIKEMQRRAKL